MNTNGDASPWAGQSKLRHALEDLRKSIERTASPSVERKREILRKRARELAARHDDGDTAARGIEVVCFEVAEEVYAVESKYVREVYPLKELTPVPCTPDFVLGIISLRGRILSVVDLKRFFGLPDAGLTNLNRVVVIESPGMELGVLADRVQGVRTVEPDKLQKAMPTLTGQRERYLHGLTEDRLIVLDAMKLLGDESLIVHEEV